MFFLTLSFWKITITVKNDNSAHNPKYNSGPSSDLIFGGKSFKNIPIKKNKQHKEQHTKCKLLNNHDGFPLFNSCLIIIGVNNLNQEMIRLVHHTWLNAKV
jgi:hypothetical protein